ncbi:MAG: hypothetical protein J5824_03805 [Lachnospiraceae bacterium]|nr:hypothetical protein [Lachnospiraceae bacterium]
MIVSTTLENYDNPKDGTNGGKATKDEVFLLSILDMIDKDYGFSDSYYSFDENRRCAPTTYAIARGVHIDSNDSNDGNESYNKTKDGENACEWWLRSPGWLASFAAAVDDYGVVGTSGGRVDYGHAIRPALWLNLNP